MASKGRPCAARTPDGQSMGRRTFYGKGRFKRKCVMYWTPTLTSLADCHDFGDGDEEVEELSEEEMEKFMTFEQQAEEIRKLHEKSGGVQYQCLYCGLNMARKDYVKRHQWDKRTNRTHCPVIRNDYNGARMGPKIGGPYQI